MASEIFVKPRMSENSTVISRFSPALEMMHQLHRTQGEYKKEYGVDLNIGVGLHAGDAIVGTMGPPDSPNVSAIGDNVNVAARLEALTKDTGCAVVVSDALALASELDFAGLEPEAATIRGRDDAVRIYRIGNAADIPTQ